MAYEHHVKDAYECSCGLRVTTLRALGRHINDPHGTQTVIRKRRRALNSVLARILGTLG